MSQSPLLELASEYASLRWWRVEEDLQQLQKHVNGTISFQREKSPAFHGNFNYRIRYSGCWATTNHNAIGTILLPPVSLWTLSHHKVCSTNSKARVIVIEFEQHVEGLKRIIQITIPFTGDGQQEKHFVKQFELAKRNDK